MFQSGRVLRNALLLSAICAAARADCRFILADQSNWSANQGFYLDVENIAGGSSTCQLSNLTLYLGVADGASWRFIGDNAAWQTGHDYTATAIIKPTYAELYLDGQLIQHTDGGFAGIPNQSLLANTIPSWAGSASAYLAMQTSLTATSSGGTSASPPFATAPLPIPVMLLAAATSTETSAQFSYGTGESLTVTAVFHLEPLSDQQSYAPYIDQYGQSAYSTFAGKIMTDADLQAAAAEEQPKLAEWGTPVGFDQWGGVLNAGWTDAATGFFHVVRHNGVWWLISPAGNPCFYTAVDTAPLTRGNATPETGRAWEFSALPPQTAPFNAAWLSDVWGTAGVEDVSFDTWNMIRKYGAAWDTTATNLAVQRIRAWGFSGLGKWSSDAGNLPIVPVLYTSVPYLTRHPDIFDQTIRGGIANDLTQQIQPRANDPLVVGWSFGNEYDGIVDLSEITQILDMGSGVSAKRALIDHALASIYGGNVAAMASAWGVTAASAGDLYASTPTPPAADVETLREYFEDQFYAFLYTTIKGIDPNHLYLGFWIVPGWWVNSTDWTLLAAHVDVIGYDRYSPMFQDSFMEGLAKSAAKPMLLGEFSFPPAYGLARGFRVYQSANAADDADAGSQYAQWLNAAARNPWCVGVAWFEYRDEPVSGRGFLGETDLNLVEGEDYAFGLVDVADRPKYDLVEQMRTANLSVAKQRLAFGPPALNAGGVVSNASFDSSMPVAPGSLVSIFGSGLSGSVFKASSTPLPITLGTTSLTLDGTGVPLIHVLPLQVDAQIPWEAAGQTQAQLQIVTDDLAGKAITVPLAAFAPAIYRMNAAGQGAIIIANTKTLAAPAGGEFNGQPARRGIDYISIFATGLGPITNQPATGAPASTMVLSHTLNPVTVEIGGATAGKVSFAGLAPGFVGLYQVNALVPAEAPAGDAVLVSIAVGGIVSNVATMAVE